MRINIVTIFPQYFAAPLALSIPGRAAAAGLVTYQAGGAGFMGGG